MPKSRKQLADEAFLRDEARRAKSLQLDIETSVPKDTAPPTVVEGSRAPIVCPRCNTDMQDQYGGKWAPMASTPYALQCGNCAHIVYVTQAVWKAVRDERYRKVGVTDVKPVKTESTATRRVRGAG